jgi:uncharacterized membrane protein
MTPVDPYPRLADALSEISARLQDISDELRTASVAAPIDQPNYPPPAPAAPAFQPLPPYAAPRSAPPAQLYPPAHAYPPPDGFAPFPSHVPAPAGPRETLWERMSREGAGSKVVAWIGGAVTLAGVVLLLVLAIQRGYIGPVPRLLLGAALGVALVAIAMRLHRAPDGRTGALAVAATGAAVLYLDTVATTAYYHFLPAWAGLGLGLAVAAGGVLIAWRWDAEVLAVFGVVGCAASAPFLTQGVTLLVGFLLVLQIASSPAQLQRHWTSLALVAAAPPVLAVAVDATVATLGRGNDAMTIAALSVTTSLVQVAVATLLARRPQVRVEAPIALVLVAPVPTLIAVMLLPRYEAAAIAGGFGAVLVALGAVRRALRTPSQLADATVAAGLAALFEAVCIAFTGDVRAVALLAAAVPIALAAERLRHVASLGAAAVFGAAGLAFALGDAARPAYVAIAPTAHVALRVVVTAGVTGIVLAAAALAVAWAAGRVVQAPDQDSARTRWMVAAIVALYGATVAVVSVGLAVWPDRHGFLVGHMLVTLSWTVGAFVLLLRHVDSAPLRVTGLALVAAALAKLVLFDLASLSGIPRVLAFLGAGLVLLAAGARYARLTAGSRP